MLQSSFNFISSNSQMQGSKTITSNSEKRLDSFLLSVHRVIKELQGECLHFANESNFTEAVQNQLLGSASTLDPRPSELLTVSQPQWSTMSYSMVGQLLTKLHFLRTVGDLSQAEAKTFIDAIARIMQKLRFELEIESITIMGDDDRLLFQGYLERVLAILSANEDGRAGKMWQILVDAMKEQNSNVPDQIIEKVQTIMMKMANLTGNAHKNDQKENEKANKNSALAYITLKQRQIQARKQQKQRSKELLSKANGMSQQSQISSIYKTKQISKTRTIYQSRKNMYMPRKKTEDYFERCQSQNSTQWSQSKMRRTIQDFNEDFEEDALVMKTPKPRKITGPLNRVIHLRLDFFE